MKKQDLHPGLLVAVSVPQTRTIERAQLLQVGGAGKRGINHTVEYQTGPYKGSEREVTSNKIVDTWENYEPTWLQNKRESIQRALLEGIAEQEKREALTDFQTILDLLECLGVKGHLSGFTTLDTATGNQIDDYALFIPYQEASKFIEILRRIAEQELLS